MELNKNEESVLEYWKTNNISAKVRAKNKDRKPFYFLDGPPFVSGDLHPGQMWVKSMKDVVLRYKRYRGYDVYDRAGYDVHGLPVERKVEASLSITSKKQIEANIGVEVFINKCKDFVKSYMGRMDADYNRFGISLDFSNPYLASDNSYMQIEWWFFKQIYDKHLIYKERRATAYCTVCDSAVSQGGLEIEYREDKDPSIIVAFRVAESKKAKINIDEHVYLMVWTTTPWTLPANVAVAANSAERYVLVKINNRRYVVAKQRLDAVAELLGQSVVVEREFYGSELEGMSYISPIEAAVPEQKQLDKFHKVVLADELVTVNDGTGLVHIAPGHGLEDYVVGRKHKLPIFCPVDTSGVYTQQAGRYAGLKVPEQANAAVMSDLEQAELLLHKTTITHSYPHCWRCDTKLLYIATEQWFANVQKVKKKLLSENNKVRWHPEVAKKWQDDFLNNSPDWTLSRQRYWGTPMPVWICGTCGEKSVVGSLDELRDIAIDKTAVERLHDLHRPYIDAVIVRCAKCNNNARRIADVFDVWFDSSVAFRASVTQQQFERLFPMDFVLEAVEQFRGWFGYQLKISAMVYGRKPFDNVVMHGMLLGEDGREMHKHLGNYVPLAEIFKYATADGFRFWCTAHTPQLDLSFSKDKIIEANKMVVMLYNIVSLLNEYADAIGHRPALKRRINPGKLTGYDAWIMSRFSTTLKQVTAHLDNYTIYEAVNAIKRFVIDDLSRVYLRTAKKRMLYAGRQQAKSTIDLINYLLFNTLVIASPVMPFCTEHIYLERYKHNGESIFLNDWPRFDQKHVNPQLESDFDVAMEVVTAILNERTRIGVKLRLPLSKASIALSSQAAYDAVMRLSVIIEEYTNVKQLEVRLGGTANKQVKPVFARLGPDFKADAPVVKDALVSADAEQLEKAIATQGYYSLHTSRGTFEIKSNHFVVVSSAPEQQSFRLGSITLDPTISEELRQEGVVREFERKVQMIRKAMGLRKSDKVAVSYDALPELSSILAQHAEELRKHIGAGSFRQGVVIQSQNDNPVEEEIEGSTIKILVRKQPP